jgi:hypothetical protein
MAIHDHFSEKASQALEQIQSITSNAADVSAEDKLKEIATVASNAIPSMPPEDQWALEFISVHRVKPLIEAVDDDCSSFASVAEVNAFTAGRPAGWRYATDLFFPSSAHTYPPIACLGGLPSGL